MTSWCQFSLPLAAGKGPRSLEVARYFSMWEASGFSVVKLPSDPERQEEALPKDDHKKVLCQSEGRRGDY